MEAGSSGPYAVVNMGQELAHDATSIGVMALAILKREGNRLLALNKEVAASCEAEAIHQMRVTTRRIQVALRYLGRYIPAGYASLRDELKPTFQALGAVRDYDVDIEQLVSSCPESYARRMLIETLSCERQKAASELAAQLGSEEHMRLLDEVRQMTQLPVSSLPKRARRRAANVAPDVIGKHFKKLQKRIRRIDSTSAQEEIHDLRKRSKKFRYLLEFFVVVYGKPAKEIVKEMKCLQDNLGEYIDSCGAIETLERLRTLAALDEGARELVKDLIEMHSARSEEALNTLPKARRSLKGKAWKKLRRKMDDVRKHAKRGEPLLLVASRANGHLKTAG